MFKINVIVYTDLYPPSVFLWKADKNEMSIYDLVVDTAVIFLGTLREHYTYVYM